MKMSLEKKIKQIKEYTDGKEYYVQEVVVNTRLGYTIGVILLVEGAMASVGYLAYCIYDYFSKLQ